MKKIKLFSFKFFLFFILVIFGYACKTHQGNISFKVDKRRIFAGDSVRLFLQPGNIKNIRSVLLNGNAQPTFYYTETLIKPEKDTTFEFQVFLKKKKSPVRKRIKIKVDIPEIIAFAAFRDRFDTSKVKLIWDVKGVENISIEGFKYDLPFHGTDSINTSESRCFTLIAKTPFTLLTKTCYVRGTGNNRVLIKKDTALNVLSENHRINMAVTETEIKNFPSEIKMKVIVYDSLGNFITHLAPPYGNDETAEKYFKSIVETVNNITKEVEFQVIEIHESPLLYDIAVTLDYSGSMTDYIASLEEATKFFINKKYPDDQYSVIDRKSVV